MEDLVDRLDSSHVTLDETDTRLIHPRFRQLRRTPLICNQDERRHEWLNNLRSKRLDMFNTFRGIQEKIGSQKVLTSEYKPHAVREFKGHLMLSEWMIEAPLDFSDEWICTICPEGKRALVVAHMGTTKAYKRNGDFVCSQFFSWLPGGSSYSNPMDTTIIDTIFDRTNSVFYVLDVLHWGIDLTESSAEMRMFWLSSKIKEIPQLKGKLKSNKYYFLPLDSIPITDLPLLMKRHPLFPLNSPKVDGILFFHKESTYVHSRSPLCLWLKPFMLPKILGIEIAPEYSQEMPQPYQKICEDSVYKLDSDHRAGEIDITASSIFSLSTENSDYRSNTVDNLKKDFRCNVDCLCFRYYMLEPLNLLIEPPIDLYTDWVFFIYPEGMRSLVITEEAMTSAYDDNGKVFKVFKSYLPGGSAKTWSKTKTVLDAIFSPTNQTFYVLDIFMWKDKRVKCEAKERFLLLKRKLNRRRERLTVHGKQNDFKFIVLESFPVSKLSQKMKIHPIYENNLPTISGILFCKKNAIFIRKSPDSGFLKPFMLPDVLDMEVSPEYLLERSEKFRNYHDGYEYRRWLKFKNILNEVPSDFKKNWLFKICPKGESSIIIAEMGSTLAYTIDGKLLFGKNFSSLLPGGSEHNPKEKTVLETIYDKKNDTFYVLDVFSSANDPFNLDAILRFKWLTLTLNKISQINEISVSNEYKFIILDAFPVSELAEIMIKEPTFSETITPKVNGIIFYHKNGKYCDKKDSAYCSWLKPFMLPSILNIKIAPEYCEIPTCHHDYHMYEEYKRSLMPYNWAREPPTNLNNDWLCSLCQGDLRMVVIASKGTTCSIELNGLKIIKDFSSLLPGGSPETYKGKTVLDTIYDSSTQIFHIIDVLYYNIDCTNSQAQIRYFWLQQKLSEIPDVSKISENNKYAFIQAEIYRLSDLYIKIAMDPVFPVLSTRIHGYRFVHKDELYNSEDTSSFWLEPKWLHSFLLKKVEREFNSHLNTASKCLAAQPLQSNKNVEVGGEDLAENPLNNQNETHHLEEGKMMKHVTLNTQDSMKEVGELIDLTEFIQENVIGERTITEPIILDMQYQEIIDEKSKENVEAVDQTNFQKKDETHKSEEITVAEPVILNTQFEEVICQITVEDIQKIIQEEYINVAQENDECMLESNYCPAIYYDCYDDKILSIKDARTATQSECWEVIPEKESNVSGIQMGYKEETEILETLHPDVQINNLIHSETINQENVSGHVDVDDCNDTGTSCILS